MFAMLAAILFGAFPLRGSLLRTIDSNLVVDGDTVHIDSGICNCICAHPSYFLSPRNDSLLDIRSLDGSTPYQIQIAATSSKLISASPIAVCSTWTNLANSEPRRFLMRGRNRRWAVWADSVYSWTETVHVYENVNGVSTPALRQYTTFRVRWRWAAVDSAVPWVRWFDSVRIAADKSVRGLPVLTALGRMRLDSVVPDPVQPKIGLVLRTWSDSATPLDWGFRYDLSGFSKHQALLPSDTVAIGATFRIEDAYNDGGIERILWSFRSRQGASDALLVVGTGVTTGTSGRTRDRPVAPGLDAYELSTGRHIRLPAAMPLGKHILDGPSGIRAILVR